MDYLDNNHQNINGAYLSALCMYVKVYNEDDERIDKFTSSIKSDYSLTTNYERVEANFTWLELMENTIMYLDNILRNPNRFIINEEEIVKVEQAKRITVESIKHLSKHTNFIQEIEDNGDVRPAKILNVNKDESFNTYENRLIYTLISYSNGLALYGSNLISNCNLREGNISLTELMNSDYLFARKFDSGIDNDIINRIFNSLKRKV